MEDEIKLWYGYFISYCSVTTSFYIARKSNTKTIYPNEKYFCQEET